MRACKIDDLISNNEDLILLTGNYYNFFGKLFYANKIKDFEKIIKSLNSNFEERIYFEIQRHGEENEKNFENYLLHKSKIFNIPLIATQEVFYLKNDMYEAHDALTCIAEKNFIDDKNRFKYSDQHYLKSDTKSRSLLRFTKT